jgi:PAS domain S-box-containing protein
MVLPVPKTEAFFTSLIENSQDAISLTDGNFNVVYRSPSAVRITGFTDEERALLGGKELTHPEDVQMMRQVMNEVLANPGIIVPCKFRTRHKDGHYIWMEGTFINRLSDPDVRGIISNLRDVTERINSHEQLQKTIRELTDYKYSLDESSIVAITDQKGIIKHANENFCRISKFSREELIGKDHRIINSGFHSKEFIKDLWVTIANGKIWRGDIKNKAKDGATYWVETTIVPFLNDQGKPFQYVAIRSDITQRKQMEENLQSSLREITDYKYALDESSIVAITDQKGIILHANDNFCKISKYSRDELIGQDHRIVNSGYHPKEFIRNLWLTIANGKIWKGDIKNKAKDGTTYWVETTIVPFLNEKGKPYQYVAIRSDITQRKETEEQLANNMIELERSNKDLEQFAYIASHDLQEPLRMVGSYMQLIEKRYKGKLDSNADEFIEFAIDGATRMKQLIADLLNYSRLNRESTLREVNLNDLVNQVLHNLSSVIKEKDALVYIEKLPVINADETQMIQLFQNLLSNALKFTESDIKPEVKISCERLDHHWLFAVADNGIGIEQQYAERIFVVFKQLHTKAKYNGTGIGLAIAKKIVERHGGRIWFNSVHGNGSVFYFTIKT